MTRRRNQAHVKVPIDIRQAATPTNLTEVQAASQEFDKEVRQAIEDGFQPILGDGSVIHIPGYDVPIYNSGAYTTGFGDNYDPHDPVQQKIKNEACQCGDGRRDGVLMGNNARMLDWSQENFDHVPQSDMAEERYAVWGPGNAWPNMIYDHCGSLPYLSTILDYLDRTTFGLGPKVVYTVARYSGGTVTHEEMDYRDAEVYLKERIMQLIGKIESMTPDDGKASFTLPIPGQEKPKSKLLAHYEKQLDEANKELEAYFLSRAKVDALLQNNNISLFAKKWIYDTTRLGIAFPRIGLSRDYDKNGNWTPSIVQLDMMDACVMRLGERNPKNRMRIEKVYWAERWRENGHLALTTNQEYVSYPCINPEHPMQDIRDFVRENRRGKRKDYYMCYPCGVASHKHYYPQLAWWSIFPSQIYQYASTLIYDKATARKNSTMWGKILFINLAYLAQIFAQAGDQGKTKEGQEAIRRNIYQQVENFLKNRDNNGKVLVMDSYPSADEKQMIDSVRIVDVPRGDDAKASATEIAEMGSLISFSCGVNLDLVGSRPWATSSATGTAQRELHLLKNGQLSPDRVTFTDFFNGFVFPVNGIIEKFQMKLFYPTLTTLDNSKTGTVEQSD